jgi:hypothetical protein
MPRSDDRPGNDPGNRHRRRAGSVSLCDLLESVAQREIAAEVRLPDIDDPGWRGDGALAVAEPEQSRLKQADDHAIP